MSDTVETLNKPAEEKPHHIAERLLKSHKPSKHPLQKIIVDGADSHIIAQAIKETAEISFTGSPTPHRIEIEHHHSKGDDGKLIKTVITMPIKTLDKIHDALGVKKSEVDKGTSKRKPRVARPYEVDGFTAATANLGVKGILGGSGRNNEPQKRF